MRKIFAIIFLLLTQSCLGGSDYYRDRVEPFLKELKPHYRPQMVDGVMEPAVFPDLVEDQKTLIGIDSNHDGVRDDMEIFINRNFPYDYERETYKQFFKRAPHYFNNYKKMNNQELKDAGNAFWRDTECFRYIYGMLKLPRSIERESFSEWDALYNTSTRAAVASYEAHKLVGENYGSGIGTEEDAFYTCPEKIKLKYPIKK